MKDVAFSCDNNGAPFLQVTVWSLLKHYQGKEPIRINVFEGFGGHSEESKEKLKKIVEEGNQQRRSSTSTCEFDLFSLRYHNVEAFVEPYKDVIMNREHSRWNIFTWTPIFTPQILADAEGNVAHFDIDMLFNDDISKILDLDLGDNLIACVAEYAKGDPIITEAVWGKGILPPTVERYFNTGTIVFNAAKCREEKTWEKIVTWYRDHYDIADRIEQDAWNALYHDRTLLLPLRWNFHDRLIKSYIKRDPCQKFWQGNQPIACLEAALEPAILHFWGPKKPWKTCHRPYRKLYHEAMRAVGQTPPREPFLAGLANWTNARNLKRVSNLRDVLIGKRRPFKLLKVLKRTVFWPLEWLAIGLGWLIFANVPHKVLFAICDGLSALMYRLDRRGRKFALESLRVVMGTAPMRDWKTRFDPDRAVYNPTHREETIIKRSYRNMARTIGHVFWTLRSARKRVARAGEMSAAGKVFLAANRPAVTVSAHVGCWEILSQLAYLEGHEMMSVAKDIGTPAMTKLLMKARKSIGQEIIPAKGAFKALMSGIRAGKSLGLLVDQPVSPLDGGVWVRFFGRPLPVSAAPAFFAAKAKAPIIVAWSRPLKDGRYRCDLLGEISAAEARDVWKTTQRCTSLLEKVIRRHPSCWAMNYDFFKYYPTPEVRGDLLAREQAAR